MTQADLYRLLGKLLPEVQRELFNALKDVVAGISITQLEAAIAASNLEQAFLALGLTGASLAGVNEAVRRAFLRGGEVEAPVVKFRFDVRSPAAEAWLRSQSSRLVTRIQEAQRDALQVALERGAIAGRNPRQTALDIAGRRGRTGRRTGGIIGLSGPQAQFVENARAQLLSGDPARMREYFTRSRRDRRFDGIVRRAMDAGRPVTRADVERITGRYADRLLQLRGETIARTETLGALQASSLASWQQAIDEGLVDADLLTKTWDSTGDNRTRDAHDKMDGQTVPFDQPFRSPTGALLQAPLDTSLGAGPEDIANCRCHMQVRIDNAAMLRRREGRGAPRFDPQAAAEVA